MHDDSARMASLFTVGLVTMVLGSAETTQAQEAAIALDFSLLPQNAGVSDTATDSTDSEDKTAEFASHPSYAAQPLSWNMDDSPEAFSLGNVQELGQQASEVRAAIALTFDVANDIAQPVLPLLTPPVATPLVQTFQYTLAQLFDGNSDSLVARVVGSAEGTRTAWGHRNPAYYGHVDPGNGVWNLGTFSYQHGAVSPEVADIKQLQRLEGQTYRLRQQAEAYGIELTLEEELNGIDLANQAPLAALGQGGYIDWLAEARRIGLQEWDGILWARTRSYLDPDTKQWNAPGLGNTVEGITHDQERRMRAIARALDAYQQQNTSPAPDPAPVAPNGTAGDAGTPVPLAALPSSNVFPPVTGASHGEATDSREAEDAEGGDQSEIEHPTWMTSQALSFDLDAEG